VDISHIAATAVARNCTSSPLLETEDSIDMAGSGMISATHIHRRCRRSVQKSRKYIAIVDKLLAEIAITRGEFSTAHAHLSAALNRLAGYSVPVVEWKLYSLLGRVRLQLRDVSAREAFETACGIVQSIGGSVQDENLRASFLGSTAVQKVLRSQVTRQSA
jgi:hypothetical protein